MGIKDLYTVCKEFIYKQYEKFLESKFEQVLISSFKVSVNTKVQQNNIEP